MFRVVATAWLTLDATDSVCKCRANWLRISKSAKFVHPDVFDGIESTVIKLHRADDN